MVCLRTCALHSSHILDIGPQVRKCGGDATLARGEVLAKRVTRDGQPLVEVQVRDLLLQAAVDVVDGQAAGSRVPRLDNVEQVRVREVVPEFVVIGGFPCGQPGVAKVKRRIALDVWEGAQIALVVRDSVEVLVVFCRGEESE